MSLRWFNAFWVVLLVLSLAPCGMAQPPTDIVEVEEQPDLDQRAHLNDYVLRYLAVSFVH